MSKHESISEQVRECAEITTLIIPSKNEESGLQTRMARIFGPLKIGGLNCGTTTIGSSINSEGTDFSSLAHTNQCELSRDYIELQRGARRLKLSLLKHICTGLMEGQDFPEDKFNREIELITELSVRRINPNQNESRDVLTFVNHLLSEKFRLSIHPPLVYEESLQLRDLYYSIRYGRRIPSGHLNNLLGLFDELNCFESDLRGDSTHNDLFENSAEMKPEILNFHRFKEQYRALFQAVTAKLDQANWRSPSFDGSFGARGSESGPDQYVRYGSTDYQRWGLEEIKVSESQLCDLIFRTSDYQEHLSTVAFSSGMSAFRAVVDLAMWYSTLNRHQDHQSNLRVAMTPDVYFEYPISLSFLPTTVNVISENSPDEIIKYILESKPSLFITAPIGLSEEHPTVNVDLFVDLILSDDFKRSFREVYGKERLIVLVDDSASGTFSKWTEKDFTDLPSGVILISLRSLVKNHQDGMDLNFVGALTVIGDHSAQDLASLRRTNASLPTKLALDQVLLANHRDLLKEKVWRHSRNARVLAQEISRSVMELGEDSFIKQVHHPDLNLEGGISGGGQILNLELAYQIFIPDRFKNRPPPELSNIVYEVRRVFVSILFALAQKSGVDINSGAGYGFDKTRIYSYESRKPVPGTSPNDEGSKFLSSYIRIAAGKEPVGEAKLIGAIFARANEIVSQMIKSSGRGEFPYSFEIKSREGLTISFLE